MFYETSGKHGLPRNPFLSCVVPRPIGWISTVDAAGTVNLAPFSYFNAVSTAPPMVMYACGGAPSADARSTKDSLANAEATGEFVFNMATEALAQQMNRTAEHVGADIDEMAMVGLTAAPSRLVRPPRVAESPVQLECRVYKIVELPEARPGKRSGMVIGSVVGVHIDDAVLVDGRIDILKIRPLARLGYLDYSVVDNRFALARPDRAE